MVVLRILRRLWSLFWAAPNSLIGLAIGSLGLITGGHCHRIAGVLEFYGGAVDRLLARAPLTGGAAAMALGHVVLGRDMATLDRCRAHELVHVRQYERWGPLFLPAYFLASFFVWLRGGHAYLDNPFEVQAYREGR